MFWRVFRSLLGQRFLIIALAIMPKLERDRYYLAIGPLAAQLLTEYKHEIRKLRRRRAEARK